MVSLLNFICYLIVSVQILFKVKIYFFYLSLTRESQWVGKSATCGLKAAGCRPLSVEVLGYLSVPLQH